MFISKRTWTPEIDDDIRDICDSVLDKRGKPNYYAYDLYFEKYNKWVDKLAKWGWKHPTLLRFIDFSFMVEGLHRGGQDDWDSHAKRFDNRIVRSSTRLARFGDEKSDWYKDKILTINDVMGLLNFDLPDTIEKDGVKYVKTSNGYVREDLKEDNDTLRGLYMLSIPSNFIFKVNLCEFAHVFKERNKDGTAHLEVKECCEVCASEIESYYPQFNRELLMKIKN